MAHVFAGVTPAGGASPAPTAERFNRRGGSQQSDFKFQMTAKRNCSGGSSAGECGSSLGLWSLEGAALRGSG